MYGFKEKTKYFNELRNPAAAEADLSLLRASDPANLKLKMFARNPHRYANDILYTLLDIKSKNDIRLNRRECEKAKEENGTENVLDTSGTCPEVGSQIGEKVQGDGDKVGNAPAVSQDGNSETSLGDQAGAGEASVQDEKNSFEIDAEIVEKLAGAELNEKEKQEAEERAEEAKNQVESLELENQELKEDLETEQEARSEAEERAEQAEQALEEEKKKESTKAAPKNKSTKSTRKSTGRTSKTKTSK